ncbi:biopolymer transporter ExbD [uncultured Cytophaga sp.]|uniref:ExbD/TolR family protein n=1 Tax=uncultured Cytophaga sp. TaxID=160238 RepID=UPI00261CC7BA|nr:biopolymer transporter ExbD [uncultured Cytophaga sp.]
MSKVKAKRQSISLDMTAMCDMAFLLLTFFILTAKLKVPEPAQFDVPSSVSTQKYDETNLIRISISNDDRIFLTIPDQNLRREMIDAYSNTFKVNLNEDQKMAFELTETFGMQKSDLSLYLGQSTEVRKKFVQTGIPADSTNNELAQWLATATGVRPGITIAIKGDKDANYSKFGEVIATLKKRRIYLFSLVTTLEAKPENL